MGHKVGAIQHIGHAFVPNAEVDTIAEIVDYKISQHLLRLVVGVQRLIGVCKVAHEEFLLVLVKGGTKQGPVIVSNGRMDASGHELRHRSADEAVAKLVHLDEVAERRLRPACLGMFAGYRWSVRYNGGIAVGNAYEEGQVLGLDIFKSDDTVCLREMLL